MSRRYKGGVISATAPTTSTSSATGVWTLPQQMQAIVGSGWPFQPAPPGSDSYTTAGTYAWVAPAGVTSVSVVAVGGGGAGVGYSYGGGGGGLGYKNNITVVPGNSYTVVVGVGGCISGQTSGGNSYFVNTSTVAGFGGAGGATGGAGGSYFGDGGGSGGNRGFAPCCCTRPGNGGAGGYSGNGGAGGFSGNSYLGSNGAGGGGAGGQSNTTSSSLPEGGGVGILGQGADGVAPGGAGSGGSGTLYGAGHNYSVTEGRGAVRIVWPGATRTFPSTCVGAP